VPGGDANKGGYLLKAKIMTSNAIPTRTITSPNGKPFFSGGVSSKILPAMALPPFFWNSERFHITPNGEILQIKETTETQIHWLL
jgi:hypothetical protein